MENTCKECNKVFMAVSSGYDLCTACEDNETIKGW